MVKANIEAGLMAVEEVFTNYAFSLPLYQREYIWEKERVIGLFQKIDRLAADEEVGRTEGKASLDPSLLGMIVLSSDHELVSLSSDGGKKFLIIDGQQRITSISLLALALCVHARRRLALIGQALNEGGDCDPQERGRLEGLESRYKKLSDDIFTSLLTRSNQVTYEPSWLLSFQNDYADQEFRTLVCAQLEDSLAAGDGNGGEYLNIPHDAGDVSEADKAKDSSLTKKTVKNIRSNYKTLDDEIQGRIKEIVEKGDSGASLEAALDPDLEAEIAGYLGKLKVVLNQKISFLVWVDDNVANAFEIFEDLNSKAEPLTAMDLLKMLAIGTVSQAEQAAVYNEWLNLVDAAESLGVDPANLESFVRHFYAVKIQSVKRAELFKSVKSKFYESPGSRVSDQSFIQFLDEGLGLLELMQSEKSAVLRGTYKEILQRIENGDIAPIVILGRVSHLLLTRAKIATYRPLFLALSASIQAIDKAGVGATYGTSLAKRILELGRLVLLQLSFENLGTGSFQNDVERVAQIVYRSSEARNFDGAINGLSEFISLKQAEVLREYPDLQAVLEGRTGKGSNFHSTEAFDLAVSSVATNDFFPPVGVDIRGLRIWQPDCTTWTEQFLARSTNFNERSGDLRTHLGNSIPSLRARRPKGSFTWDATLQMVKKQLEDVDKRCGFSVERLYDFGAMDSVWTFEDAEARRAKAFDRLLKIWIEE